MHKVAQNGKLLEERCQAKSSVFVSFLGHDGDLLCKITAMLRACA